jgi:hypothetical protein
LTRFGSGSSVGLAGDETATGEFQYLNAEVNVGVRGDVVGW